MGFSDTIFALASAQGRAGVAVVRISGPRAFVCVEHMAGVLPEPRKTTLRTLRHNGEVLDKAMVITFKKGASFTGEDIVELHLHGGVAVIKAVLNALGSFEEYRVAEPGEFTRRALENNQLDLPQVEGLADLIEAETEAQRKQAVRVMRGSLSDICNFWHAKLVRAMALLEAVIDFADEDVPVDVHPEVTEILVEVLAGITAEISGSRAAERIRDGFEVALVGRPNIGKSTLLNRIAGRDVAITSEIAGTTRDVIEVRLDLAGLPVTLMDLAGIRDSADAVETLGVDRAILRAGQADLRVFLVDVKDDAQNFGVEVKKDDIVVIGKGDLCADEGITVSGKTSAGVGALLKAVTQVVVSKSEGSSLVIRQRHLEALVIAQEYINLTLLNLKDAGFPGEVLSADLRFAISALDQLIGRVDVEQVLGEIFAGFCIGK